MKNGVKTSIQEIGVQKIEMAKNNA